jgi:hypothetical protein
MVVSTLWRETVTKPLVHKAEIGLPAKKWRVTILGNLLKFNAECRITRQKMAAYTLPSEERPLTPAPPLPLRAGCGRRKGTEPMERTWARGLVAEP